jgi:cobalamin biosynthesis Mg chelatase CobN
MNGPARSRAVVRAHPYGHLETLDASMLFVYNSHEFITDRLSSREFVAMPKRSSSGRSGSQRQKTRAQKGIELVRPISEEDKAETVEEKSQVKESVATATATSEEEISKPESPQPDREAATRAKPVEIRKSKSVSEHEPEADSRARAGSSSKKSSSSTSTLTSTTPETVSSKAGSASARLAARRQATQRTPRTVSLITAEHFSYVRRDLIFIGILAVIMVAAIIILYFVLGR